MWSHHIVLEFVVVTDGWMDVWMGLKSVLGFSSKIFQMKLRWFLCEKLFFSLFFLRSGFPRFVKLAALEIPLQYDGFTQTLHGFPLEAFNIARARLGKSFIKSSSNLFLSHKASEYWWLYTKAKHSLLLSAKNAERARLGKSFIKGWSTVFLANKASEYWWLHTNATRLLAFG